MLGKRKMMGKMVGKWWENDGNVTNPSGWHWVDFQTNPKIDPCAFVRKYDTPYQVNYSEYSEET